jgi:hypothetical protein
MWLIMTGAEHHFQKEVMSVALANQTEKHTSGRLTRSVCEKIAQNVAQPILINK